VQQKIKKENRKGRKVTKNRRIMNEEGRKRKE
jgi:hypothetical protein